MAVGQVLIGRKEIPLTVPRPPLLYLQADAYAHSDANADQSGEDEEPRARHETSRIARHALAFGRRSLSSPCRLPTATSCPRTVG